jgi:HEAT repeat protein
MPSHRSRFPSRFPADLAEVFNSVREWTQAQLARWTPQIAVPGHERTATVEQAAIAGLHDREAHRRWEAAAALGRNSQRNAQAIGGLLETLSDPEPFVRWQAAEALARQEIGRVFPVLSEAVRDKDPLRRAAAAEALGKLSGEAACIELLNALADPVAAVRVAAAQALGACGDPTSGPALLPLLDDPDPAVVAAVAAALGSIGDARTAVSLAQTLDKADRPLLVRRAVVAALARVPHPEAQPTLLNALNDPDAQVRGYAAQALGQVGNEAAWTALEALEKDDSRLLQGTVADVARRAMTLLERRGRQAPPTQQTEGA